MRAPASPVWVGYNENDPKAAAWLRELIAQGHLPAGIVDERSIEEIEPDDIPGTFHTFAGIGGWPYALALAGWDAADPVWTGSCPCQSFSSAGKQRGVEDERHLWPAWFRLIAECRPNVIFGEQVTGAIGHGWLDGVFADLEGEGYRCGAAVLGAHSVGAPHIRQRLFWVADAHGGDASAEGLQRGREHGQQPEDRGDGGRLANAQRERGREWSAGGEDAAHVSGAGEAGWGRIVIGCADAKARRVEPGIQPLAHGVSARVVRLRGYGNAIVPHVAAEFVMAYMETTG